MTAAALVLAVAALLMCACMVPSVLARLRSTDV